MAKTCQLWMCRSDLLFVIKEYVFQHLSVSDMVSIFLSGDSRMIGITFIFSLFFDGFARGLSVPRQTSSGYSLFPFWSGCQVCLQIVGAILFQVFRMDSIRPCWFVVFKLL